MSDHCELLEQLALALLQPMGRSDTALLDRLIADDFMEVGASGRSFGKDEVLARLPLETGVSFTADQPAVKLLSPTVGLVTCLAERTANGSVAQSKRSPSGA